MKCIKLPGINCVGHGHSGVKGKKTVCLSVAIAIVGKKSLLL